MRLLLVPKILRLENHLYFLRPIFSTPCSWWQALELWYLLESIWSLSGAQKSSLSLLSPSIFSLVQVPLFLPSSFTLSQDKETTCELSKCHALCWNGANFIWFFRNGHWASSDPVYVDQSFTTSKSIARVILYQYYSFQRIIAFLLTMGYNFLQIRANIRVSWNSGWISGSSKAD